MRGALQFSSGRGGGGGRRRSRRSAASHRMGWATPKPSDACIPPAGCVARVLQAHQPTLAGSLVPPLCLRPLPARRCPPLSRQVFSEFAGRKPVKGVEGDTYMGSGDVKYHLGTSYDRPTISGEMRLAAWPGVLASCRGCCCRCCLGVRGTRVQLHAGLCAPQAHACADLLPRDLSLSPSNNATAHLTAVPPAAPRWRAGKRVHMSLLANPSHLEAVNTVCMGKARLMNHWGALALVGCKAESAAGETRATFAERQCASSPRIKRPPAHCPARPPQSPPLPAGARQAAHLGK